MNTDLYTLLFCMFCTPVGWIGLMCFGLMFDLIISALKE
jgi:hypothetical protein